MAEFQLSIHISPSDLQQILDAGQQVAIARAFNEPDLPGEIIWLSFTPLEDNTVTWNQPYGLYASRSQVAGSNTIEVTAKQYPAEPAVFYPFTENGFAAPSGKLDTGQYGTINQTTTGWTMGLLAPAVINGTQTSEVPINAVDVLTQEQAVFTPIQKLMVFLHSKSNNGSVISTVTGPPISLDFLAANPVQSIIYDGGNGHFEQR